MWFVTVVGSLVCTMCSRVLWVYCSTEKAWCVDPLPKDQSHPTPNEVWKRRWKLLVHVFIMQESRHPYYALKWNPSGERMIGKLKETCRRKIEKETTQVGKTWNELKWLHPRLIWMVKACLCLYITRSWDRCSRCGWMVKNQRTDDDSFSPNNDKQRIWKLEHLSFHFQLQLKVLATAKDVSYS